MAYWPTQLPKPKLDGYSLAPQAAFARTDMDAGPARQRRRFTQAPTEITLEIVLTDNQMAIFEGWFEHHVDSGAAWFYAPMRNGKGVTTVEARFVEPWQSQPLGAELNRISCKWETRNRPVMSEVSIDALAGGNLVKNGDLLGGNIYTADSWERVLTGVPVYAIHYKPEAPYSVPWDSEQLVFYTSAQDDTVSAIWLSQPIKVDASRNYEISAWARLISGTPIPYLGVMCMDISGANIGYVYPAGLNGIPLSTSYEYKAGQIGPAGSVAFIGGTVSVRVIWLGALNAGASMATRFEFKGVA